ncbi:hypothetical protein FA13DRAFT_1727403 [Coprinellus micaceus]|uniref:Uncharacterized protein n=1 Tax=Coprinellus micaceus TaxID=71717 RepID=A0A4Y7TQK3_COPMI|nr:hypothetical protein FA13DRAFT_1727403 [Coprinellus micaceus]
MNLGHLVVVVAVAFFLVASYAVLLSAFYPLPSIPVLNVLGADTHYKYLVILLIPTVSYFVIANWVGWQYYQNS